jgi:hypothetical protein
MAINRFANWLYVSNVKINAGIDIVHFLFIITEIRGIFHQKVRE